LNTPSRVKSLTETLPSLAVISPSKITTSSEELTTTFLVEEDLFVRLNLPALTVNLANWIDPAISFDSSFSSLLS
jgi:hypothetical protein